MCACVRLFLFDNCFVPLLEPHDFPTIFRLADWEGVFFFFFLSFFPPLFLFFFSSEDKLDTTISRESGPTYSTDQCEICCSKYRYQVPLLVWPGLV